MNSSPLAALHDEQLRRLFGAQVTSALGHSALWLCAGIWVRQLTGSNGSAALTFFFLLTPALLAPVAGVVVDRLPRRAFLAWTNIVGAIGLLPLLTVQTSEQTPVIYAVMFFYGVVTVACGPAQSALIAESAPASELAAMNGLMRSAVEASKLVAPAAGAGLFALTGPRVVVVLDVLAFLAAAWLLHRLPKRPAPEPVHPRESMTHQLTGGFRYLFRVRALRSLVVVCTLFMAGAGLNEALRWGVVTQGLHAAPEWIGALQAVMGLGSVLVGLTAAAVITRHGELNAAALSLATFGLGCALWTSPAPALIVVGALLVGGGATLLVVAAVTMLQTRAEANMQGRAFAAFELLTTAPQVASVALGAHLVEALDYRLILLALALVALASAALAVVYARTLPATTLTSPRKPLARAPRR